MYKVKQFLQKTPKASLLYILKVSDIIKFL